MQGLDVLREWVGEARRIVFFGGAGVSTESGIPDFRGEDGLYRQTYAHPPEEILSAGFLRREPDVFYRFYRERVLHPEAAPNAAHRTLARWEAEGKLLAVITQNIDGLHQRAGSRSVYELHGSVHRNHCQRCRTAYGAEAVAEAEGVPRCACGGIIRPDVVLYGETLDEEVLAGAMAAIAGADVLIVGGTSLVVYPAAGLIDCYAGRRLVLINRTPTGRDGRADLIVRGAIGGILSAL